MKSDTKIGIFVVLLLVGVVVVLLAREVMNRKQASEPAVAESTEGGTTEGTDAEMPSAPATEGAVTAMKDEVTGQPVVFDPAAAPTGLEPAPLPGTPMPGAAVVEAPIVPVPASAPAEYVVQSGDTLEKISKQLYGKKSQWKLIAEANPGLNPANLKVGARLVIPPAPASAPAAPTGTATDAGMMVAAAGGTSYTVKSGDTLEKISKQVYGKKSEWKRIAQANPGVRPENLKVGAVLAIPEGAASAAPAARATSSAPVSAEPWKTPGATRLVTTARSGG